MSVTSTYIMGKNAMFSDERIQVMAGFNGYLLRQVYLASWRVLHIDGFEIGFRPLPAHIGFKIQFNFSTILSVCGNTPASPESESKPELTDRCDRCGATRWAHEELNDEACSEFRE